MILFQCKHTCIFSSYLKDGLQRCDPKEHYHIYWKQWDMLYICEHIHIYIKMYKYHRAYAFSL